LLRAPVEKAIRDHDRAVARRFDDFTRQPRRIPRSARTQTSRRKLTRLSKAAALAARAKRLSVERKTIVELNKTASGEVGKILREMTRSGTLAQLVNDAARVHHSLYTKGASAKTMRQRVKNHMNRSRKENAMLLRVIRDEAVNVNATFGGALDVLRGAQVLLFEAGSAPMIAVVNEPHAALRKMFDFCAVSKAASVGFTEEDWAIIRIAKERAPKALEAAIADRQKRISLRGFTDGMFDTLRETLENDLYVRASGALTEGALGALDLARIIGDDLRGAYGDALPDEAEDRLMLWARTEGTVVQNDALMAIGREAQMDGKVWQTADVFARDAHLLNAEDGVIPEGDTFSDGSTDGGSGSESPYNCILPGVIVQGEFTAGLRALYCGPAVEIKTAQGGNPLRLTVNHPILTENGFVPAGALKQGDKIFCCDERVKRGAALSACQDDEHHAPAPVEQVFDALAKRAALSNLLHVHPGDTGGYLYSDVKFIQGDITVVLSDRLLGSEYFKFAKTHAQHPPLHGTRAKFLCSASRIPRAATLFNRGGTTLLERALLAPLRFGAPAQRRLAIGVALTDIVSIRQFNFCGHVFDLQSVTGLITASGAQIKNCRCAVGPAMLEEVEKG